MSTKFTAGPHQVLEGDVWDTRGDGEPGIPLARVNYGSDRLWGRKISREEAEANMVLFAAASELYDALSEAVDVFEGMMDDEINLDFLPRLRGALAKARGEV